MVRRLSCPRHARVPHRQSKGNAASDWLDGGYPAPHVRRNNAVVRRRELPRRCSHGGAAIGRLHWIGGGVEGELARYGKVGIRVTGRAAAHALQPDRGSRTSAPPHGRALAVSEARAREQEHERGAPLTGQLCVGHSRRGRSARDHGCVGRHADCVHSRGRDVSIANIVVSTYPSHLSYNARLTDGRFVDETQR
jgi:hypothetical protein